jgi:hypothetical protein
MYRTICKSLLNVNEVNAVILAYKGLFEIELNTTTEVVIEMLKRYELRVIIKYL